MRRNYEEERASALEEEKINSIQAVIGIVVLLLVVVIFCFAVWRITHADHSGTTTGQNAENTQDSIADWDGQSTTPETVESTEEESTEPEESSEPENALGMTFEPVEEYVTAKDVTNLRSEPSTDQGQLTVVTQLSNGQNARRTGINADTGWSRLEYNGQVVYAVSQYLLPVEVEIE
ncbi:MAG: hypothetical protein J6B43_09120 [Lachnospiraceae bacterium]|nr:hypothetical protein [Lachnospiraceae bacterium]